MSRDWVNMAWSEKTWGERAQSVLCMVAAGAFGVGALFAVVVYVIGPTLDGIAYYSEQRERCLKRATNGLEIERCR